MTVIHAVDELNAYYEANKDKYSLVTIRRLKENGTDIIFENVDEYDVFTCFVKNIPVQHYATDLVCKVYTKVNVGGEEFILYSEPVIGNPYDTAKKLLKEDAGNEELLKIIFDYENTLGLPGDDLFD